MRITDKYVFFYKDWLSNYQRTNFEYDITYLWPDCNWGDFKIATKFTSTEQAFMYCKALCFFDFDTANKIINDNNPDYCRKLGRTVKNYKDEIWDDVRYELFYELNYQKYSQDNKLKAKLLDSQFDDKTFVEASPIDKIWGVGLDENNPLIDDESNWKGQNLLGKLLTNIRKELKNELLTKN